MKPVSLLVALTAWAGATGCSGQPALAGAGEPLVVHGATFIAGALPGSSPPDGGAASTPDVTAIMSANNAFHAGEADRTLSGDVSDDASSVAVAFSDLGTGYWLLVPGPPDANSPGTLTWSMTFDIGADVPPGLHTLRFAALDPAGASGTQSDLPVCIDTPFADNFNACIPSRAPPAAVLSLSWDTAVDLDLEVVTPSGVLVGPHHPTTSASTDGGVGPDDGVLDRDSGANCAPDHLRREDLVWKQAPAPGQYLAYANLFSACGQAAVRFTLSLLVAEPVDGGQALQQELVTSGELTAVEANGGAGMGLYLGAFSFPSP